MPITGASRTGGEPYTGVSNPNTWPSLVTSQYPPVAGSTAMPTTGAWTAMLPVDPRNRASPNANTPPSDPTSQYPAPSTVGTRPTMGALFGWPAREPKNRASPNANTPPSVPTSQ